MNRLPCRIPETVSANCQEVCDTSQGNRYGMKVHADDMACHTAYLIRNFHASGIGRCNIAANCMEEKRAGTTCGIKNALRQWSIDPFLLRRHEPASPECSIRRVFFRVSAPIILSYNTFRTS